MNELMGMKRDNDIVDKDLATEEEVMAFENGDEGSTAPELQPLRPYLEGNLRCSWNATLCEMFLQQWEESQEERLTVEKSRAIEDRFEKRLENLKKALARMRKHTEEELKDEMARSRHISRVTGRRDRVSSFISRNLYVLTEVHQLWQERRQICMDMMTKRDGSIHSGWKGLLRIVERLGMCGMSSDESEVDDVGRPYYVVRARRWRHSDITTRLDAIDKSKNTTSGYGETRPGNPPRRRVRRQNAPVSTRDPPVGCPENYYGDEFMANLDNKQFRDLQIKEEAELPQVNFYD